MAPPLEPKRLHVTCWCCFGPYFFLWRWCQNSATGGTELRTKKRLQRWSYFGSTFFLSVGHFFKPVFDNILLWLLIGGLSNPVVRPGKLSLVLSHLLNEYITLKCQESKERRSCNTAQWDRIELNVSYGSHQFIAKQCDWIKLVFAHLFPLNSGTPIASGNFTIHNVT